MGGVSNKLLKLMEEIPQIGSDLQISRKILTIEGPQDGKLRLLQSQ